LPPTLDSSFYKIETSQERMKCNNVGEKAQEIPSQPGLNSKLDDGSNFHSRSRPWTPYNAFY